jgi:hypothetical protein
MAINEYNDLMRQECRLGPLKMFFESGPKRDLAVEKNIDFRRIEIDNNKLQTSSTGRLSCYFDIFTPNGVCLYSYSRVFDTPYILHMGGSC